MKLEEKYELQNNPNDVAQFERSEVKTDLIYPHCYKVFQTQQGKLRHELTHLKHKKP